ncbi:MAG: dethiobiotin synthase [Bacteroidetes bacterium]|nr:dethiobiotin synthase [Rhodothermia bacterium]MCS7154775.1 dethiobiotin synthase [Bacteroidota bacterium]MCX7907068.1 dethiobiotin synthase [Bacteroidota bacterium]MDW8137568.1 dethiobiotin synthase [Bacteroidota bacterium]MDW8285478.1 dethiobiotin synthase [Bacteroidota bacterium]
MMMATSGRFVVGTDRNVGKTVLSAALVALLRERGVPATMMTPIETGGMVEDAYELLQQIGVQEPRRLVTPIRYETLASPYVASLIERRPVDLDLIEAAFQEQVRSGKFVIVEGAGARVPLAKGVFMLDLMRRLGLPALIVARSGRGTLNHCLLTLEALERAGIAVDGFILNGFGQYGEGFAEALNPEVLEELAAPVPVLAVVEWRPQYQGNIEALIRDLAKQPKLRLYLDELAASVGPALA